MWLRYASPLLGIGAAYGMVGHFQELHAEEWSSAFPDRTLDKLPIYDAVVLPLKLRPVKGLWQDEISRGRQVVSSSFSKLDLQAQSLVSSYIGWERRAEDHFVRILSKGENANPGLLYVGIATLAGSIVSRNRGVILRLTVPSMFAASTFVYLYPRTTADLSKNTSWSELRSRFTPS